MKKGFIAAGIIGALMTFTAEASLQDVCERTLEAQANLAAFIKTGDKSFLPKAFAAGNPLGYQKQWYQNEVRRLGFNHEDMEELYYLTLEGVSPSYQEMHDKYMRTCTVMPAQYLTNYYELVRRGLIAQDQKPDTSDIPGMRHQQGSGPNGTSGLKAAIAAQQAGEE